MISATNKQCDNTLYYSCVATHISVRLWVNLTENTLGSKEYEKQKFFLDTLSCWGGNDTNMQTLQDGTKTLSWEFTTEAFRLAVEPSIKKFLHWQNEEYFKLANKRSVS